jgi:alpha-glucosidase
MRALLCQTLLGATLLAACADPCPPLTYSGAPPYAEKDRAAEAARLLGGADWYRHAVFYELYVRSFQDSDGDGVGDLPGLTSRLDDLRALGADALWLMPIMPSPLADSGYDVSDYESILPAYGTLADFDALLAAAHARQMRVFVDLVLNHTSDQHPWFTASRSSRDDPKADWYVWSDQPGRDDIGCGPVPTFGTSAWTFAPERGQYYFHRFYPFQPDLNYRNPQVVEATLDVARFWLDRGVDGFRCDAVGLLYESATGCDVIPETQDYFRKLRALVDSYPDRALVAEPFGFDDPAPYFGDGHDMFHMAFDFTLGMQWGGYLATASAQQFAQRLQTVQSTYPAGAQDALFIGSHDIPRAWDAALGLASRWRRAALIQMTAPGTPFIYYGEELGLLPGQQVVVDSRDHARTPMLWSGGAGWGFTAGEPWIAFGGSPEATNLEAERGDPASTYGFYRELLALRRGRESFGAGSFRVLATDEPAVLLYQRGSADESYLVAVSTDEDKEICAVAQEADLGSDPSRLFGTASASRDGRALRVRLPPGGMGVFRVR